MNGAAVLRGVEHIGKVFDFGRKRNLQVLKIMFLIALQVASVLISTFKDVPLKGNSPRNLLVPLLSNTNKIMLLLHGNFSI